MPVTRPLDGYPDSWGAQRASVFPVTGPNPARRVYGSVNWRTGRPGQRSPQV